jgi:hypothetical protein
LDLDTPTLLVGLVVSAVGFVLFRYGKAQQRIPHLVFGLVLMVYPYFTGGWVLTLAIGAGLVASLWLIVRSGR